MSSTADASQIVCSYEFNGIYSRHSVLYPMTSQNNLFCLRDTHVWPWHWVQQNLPVDIVIPVCMRLDYTLAFLS